MSKTRRKSKAAICALLCAVLALGATCTLLDGKSARAAAEDYVPQILYEKDFSQTADSETFAEDEGWAHEGNDGTHLGSGYIEGGAFHINARNAANTVRFVIPQSKFQKNGQNVNNYIFEADITMVDQSDDARWLGLAVRHTPLEDGKNFQYYHGIIRKNGAMEFGRLDDKAWAGIQRASFGSSIDAARYYRLKVAVFGQTAKYYINNKLYLTAEMDSKYTEGDIGFHVSNGVHAKIGYFKVTELLSLDDLSNPQETMRNPYKPDTEFDIPPAVVSSAYMQGLPFDGKSKAPSSVTVSVSDALKAKVGDSAEFELSDTYRKLGNGIIPVFEVRSQAAAEGLGEYLESVNCIDAFVMSDDSALVKTVRDKATLVRGIVKYGELPTAADAVAEVNACKAKIAAVPSSELTAEFIRNVQLRLTQVYAICSSREELMLMFASGVDGVITDDALAAIDILESLPKSILRAPMIAGHRGIPDFEPENTVKGALRAYSCGAEVVELDVKLSTDNKLFVFHDDTLDSLTDGTGRAESKSYEELKTYKIRHGGRLSDECIPLLDGFFEAVKDTDRVLYVEIKSSKAEILPLVKQKIDEYGVAYNVAFIGGSMEQMKLARKLMPEIPAGYLLNIEGDDAQYIESCLRSLAPDNLTSHPSHEKITNGMVYGLQLRGYYSGTWTYIGVTRQDYEDDYANGYYALTVNDSSWVSNTVRGIEPKEFYWVGIGANNAFPIKADGITAGGGKTEVQCGLEVLSGDIALTETEDGKYYADGEGEARVILRCRQAGKSYWVFGGVTVIKATSRAHAIPDASAFTIDYSNNTIHFTDAVEVYADEYCITAIESGATVRPEITVYVRYKATDDGIPASELTPVTMPSKAAKPSGIAAPEWREGKLVFAASDTLEYRLKDGEWQSEGVFEGLKPNTEYVIYYRTKSDGSKFASDQAFVRVKTGEAAAAPNGGSGCGSSAQSANLLCGVSILALLSAIPFVKRSFVKKSNMWLK